jgi:hypothetical protein
MIWTTGDIMIRDIIASYICVVQPGLDHQVQTVSFYNKYEAVFVNESTYLAWL